MRTRQETESENTHNAASTVTASRKKVSSPAHSHAHALCRCMTNYALACVLGQRYLHRALPRIVTLALDYFDVFEHQLAEELNPDSVSPQHYPSTASHLLAQPIALEDAKRVLSVMESMFCRIEPAQWLICFAQITSRSLQSQLSSLAKPKSSHRHKKTEVRLHRHPILEVLTSDRLFNPILAKDQVIQTNSVFRVYRF